MTDARALHKRFFKVAKERGSYQSIVCLSGPLPDKSFFELAQEKSLPIIACDGAINTLYPMGIPPKCVVGDLDSANPDYLAGVPVYKEVDQSRSDFQKGLGYANKKGLLPALIVGLADGYLDHVLNNINIFHGSDHIFYAPPLMGFCLKEKSETHLRLPLNTKISIFGLPQASVSTTGLKWELSKSPLSFPGENSCLNRTKSESLIITVHSGGALVMIYLHEVLDGGS